MSFRTQTCVVLICDGSDECDPWDEGTTPHFNTEAEAIEYATRGDWTFTDGRALCSACTAAAECARAGHVWEDWRVRDQYGIGYRTRWCERCSDYDYDPPFAQLAELWRVVVDAEDVLKAATPE